MPILLLERRYAAEGIPHTNCYPALAPLVNADCFHALATINESVKYVLCRNFDEDLVDMEAELTDLTEVFTGFEYRRHWESVSTRRAAPALETASTSVGRNYGSSSHQSGDVGYAPCLTRRMGSKLSHCYSKM
ncbi:hypothetical protein CY34DRAFT_333799 [Suillus luteus UH-Slu-Lm8-n1]|uniref:Uncharacterized protein n=1 Tax=Suillus luteus UH-Slu-Lm8-n1 TaxID=930992 RepID=A0A0D0BMH0_9AGAM|nr:hypothetical protein CY34DRAFT_333799 [Suillus luteus UH-Slu-Lm8-n1]